ncbi:MAG TPA: DUF962 domain-containing protein [Deltaproteobacteria bacterium]|nr:DUF962 domain-containing protein [Deltaproteobacteria bacterium]
MPRIQSLDQFWIRYLSEHRAPRSRMLHFLGTSLFFCAVGVSVITHPVVFPAVMAGVVGLAWWGATRVEPRQAAFVPMLAMIALASLASPLWVPLGVSLAYAAAWVGHFRIENNRPATFQYPIWSLLCDLRMWGEMARGRLWSGDPLDELGLRGPSDGSFPSYPPASL